MDEKVVTGLRSRYPRVHPLMFHRSMEKAKSVGDLFDILEMMPDKFPIVWNDDTRRWETTDDLFRSKAYVAKQRQKSDE